MANTRWAKVMELFQVIKDMTDEQATQIFRDASLVRLGREIGKAEVMIDGIEPSNGDG